MFAKMIAEGPFNFSQFDFKQLDLKKLLCLLTRQRSALGSDGRVKPLAWIRRRREQFPEAAIYRLPDGRIFCASVDFKANRIDVVNARRLIDPSPSLFRMTNATNSHLPSELGPKGEAADFEVKKWLAIAFHGYQEAARLFAETLF